MRPNSFSRFSTAGQPRPNPVKRSLERIQQEQYHHHLAQGMSPVARPEGRWAGRQERLCQARIRQADLVRDVWRQQPVRCHWIQCRIHQSDEHGQLPDDRRPSELERVASGPIRREVFLPRGGHHRCWLPLSPLFVSCTHSVGDVIVARELP
jgi:hypothetical protein